MSTANRLPATAALPLVRLLQLASPALPVGAYSYSQGLEAAIEANTVRDATSAQQWISDMLLYVMATMEAPMVALLQRAWQQDDPARVNELNGLFLASRETAELRAETVQMGYSLTRLLDELQPHHTDGPCARLQDVDEPAFPTAYACAAQRWQIPVHDALIGYLWSWLENQVMAAIKAVPLGQTDGQRTLLALGAQLDTIANQAARLTADELENFAPRLAILSSQHATQYSRLFRS